MKKIFTTIFILTILISACSSSISATPGKTSESVPTVTQVSAIVTATEIPVTSTLAPIPTISLPVSQFTPVPSSNTKITAENVQDLQEIAKYYGEVKYIAKLTNDKKHLFILDSDGLTKYDYASMEVLTHIPAANSVSDLQISNDGGLLILDNNWLLDLRNDNEPKLHLLSEKIHLLSFYSRDFALSPDGSTIAVVQVRCYDLCDHKLQIVSIEDFKVLHVSTGVSSQDIPTYSGDGKYIALADVFIEAHPDGSTNPAGASVSIWTTSDFIKVSTFDDIEFPFYVTDIAFSEDNTLLAISQRTSIDIYDIVSGEMKVTIADLCDSEQRKVMFAPTAPLVVLESSDCSSGEWTISGSTARLSADNVPDLSRIVFDEKGNYKSIPFLYPTTSNLRAYKQGYYFEFLNSDILSFKNFDIETLDRHSCELSLANSTLECQSHAPKYIWQGSKLELSEYRDVILATDGKYYGYVVGKSTVDIHSFENPSRIYYSVSFRDYTFDLLALDPINNLIFYDTSINSSYNKVIIQDMTNGQVLEQWEGQTFISDLVISENRRYAALCRAIGNYNDGTDKDRLVLFDLSKKRIVYNTDFNCNGTALALSSDGATLASEKGEGATSTTAITRVMLLDTSPPYETKYLDLDSWFFPAVDFSHDGTMLVAGCSNNEICFLDPSNGREIYRLQAHSRISNLAFSKDGSVLATASDWGLISLWAVPPFTSNTRQTQSSLLSAYTPGFSWNFDEDDNFEGWGEQDWQIGGLKDVRVIDGNLSAIATDSGTFLYSNESLSIDASKFTQIEIRMRVSDGNSANFYFRHENDDMSEELSHVFDIQSGVEFKTYVLDLGKIPGWKGIIYQLRLDPIHDSPGAAIDIDYIRLLP